MNWPEALVAISGMICFVSLLKTLIRAVFNNSHY